MDLTSTVECGSDILQRANATDSGSHNDDETLEQQDLRKAGFKKNTIAKIIEIFEVDPDYPCACDIAKEYIESRQVEPYNFSIDNSQAWVHRQQNGSAVESTKGTRGRRKFAMSLCD
eukprot:m.328558 g.328558  ORF g.328558 m.328558 type:complete len:117 (+) comp20433_c0_seq1:267-617(+)